MAPRVLATRHIKALCDIVSERPRARGQTGPVVKQHRKTSDLFIAEIGGGSAPVFSCLPLEHFHYSPHTLINV